MNTCSGNLNTDSGNCGKSVHLRPESLFTFNQNRCSPSTGITVQLTPEYAYSLPGIESVDRFTNKKVSELEIEVARILQGSGYERVYASELNSPIPIGISVESNLVYDRPLVFDGYFSWID